MVKTEVDRKLDAVMPQLLADEERDRLNDLLTRVSTNQGLAALASHEVLAVAFKEELQKAFRPAQADTEKLQLAQRVFGLYAPSIYLVLATASLPACFASAPIAGFP